MAPNIIGKCHCPIHRHEGSTKSEDGKKTAAFPFGIQERWARAITTLSAGKTIMEPQQQTRVVLSKDLLTGSKAQKGSSARHCPALSGARDEGLNGEEGNTGEGAIREIEEKERHEMAESKARNSSRASTTQEKIAIPFGGSDRGTDSPQNNGRHSRDEAEDPPDKRSGRRRELESRSKKK